MEQEKLIGLLRKYKDGDNSSFEVFYNNTYKIIFSYSYKILKDYHLASDITHNTFIKLMENVDQIDENKNIVNWLITVSKNMSLNEYNKRKKQTTLNEEITGIEDKNISTPTLDLMNKILNEEEINIVTLILIQGYKRKEIAKILDIPISTVTWKYKEALKKIRKEHKGE